MTTYTVTIGSINDANILVTFKHIECADRDTAGMVAIGMMAVPAMWAVSRVISMNDELMERLRKK